MHLLETACCLQGRPQGGKCWGAGSRALLPGTVPCPGAARRRRGRVQGPSAFSSSSFLVPWLLLLLLPGLREGGRFGAPLPGGEAGPCRFLKAGSAQPSRAVLSRAEPGGRWEPAGRAASPGPALFACPELPREGGGAGRRAGGSAPRCCCRAGLRGARGSRSAVRKFGGRRCQVWSPS